MLNFTKKQDGENLTIALAGRLDSMSAPDFKKEVQEMLPGVKKLVFDFAELEYISSDGLRAILSAQKTMSKQGSMVVKNVPEDIMEIFEITNFLEILTIE